ncbi:FAD linked oxidase N-terminal [Penicillium maclennaniae]|uniref:FAD linked oxidase N-terminal n=1 Tax=Penicillium maclennaniae TaxID=1343394 RepID=UPI0025412AB5|nr:FAD linked oxidase N-terminal [Penicillium maclennaniae]KAJ5677101.1 FAD linked oxidase N-terminal [Penicillium maclennaniae]
MAYGVSVDTAGDPSQALADAAEWDETARESVLRDWAFNSGAYMNKGNPFSSTWKRDFYGESYDQLLEVKCKYGPARNLFLWSVVGSDMGNHDLHSGLLCRVE